MASIEVVRTGPPIRRTSDERATLIGLGLNKMHRVSEPQDSPEVRGMIRKVQHMVEVWMAEPFRSRAIEEGASGKARLFRSRAEQVVGRIALPSTVLADVGGHSMLSG